MTKPKNSKKRKAFMRDSDEESENSCFELDAKQKKSLKYQGTKKGRWDET